MKISMSALFALVAIIAGFACIGSYNEGEQISYAILSAGGIIALAITLASSNK